MQLGQLHRARAECGGRVSWTAILIKAYGLVGAAIPELRDVYVTYPRRLLYRHPHTVASVSIHRRDDQGNERLIFGRFVSPETQSLSELQIQLDAYRTGPLEEVFREGRALERKPAWVRSLVWWCLMHCSGRKRAKHVGTFSVSTLGGQGVLNLHHPLVTCTSLALGPLDALGECDVALICDHRVIDGVLAAEALETLVTTLCSTLVSELQELSLHRQAA
jgi:hypothetical protein